MSNKLLEKYISEYKAGIDFEFVKKSTCDICGATAEIEQWEFFDGLNRRERCEIRLQKNGFEYRCECVDVLSSHPFEKVVLKGKSYIFMRKSLYGFVLLDADELTEKYEYFPECVLKGEESYIFVSAKSFDDFVIFHGCYWADSYFHVVCDPDEMRFLNLSEFLGINTDNGESVIEANRIILCDKNPNGENTNASITYHDLRELINKKGLYNI